MENSVIKCKRLGCDNTFTKYHINRKGQAYGRAREHCCRSHIVVSPTTREKQRKGNIGKKVSDETRERIRLSHTGWTPSQDMRDKARLRRGPNNPNYKGDDVGYVQIHKRMRQQLP
jgi:hypothetical protein